MHRIVQHDHKETYQRFPAVNIMIIHDFDSFDVYYQIAGYPFTFAFGIPDREGFYQVRKLAIANTENYVEVLFN